MCGELEIPSTHWAKVISVDSVDICGDSVCFLARLFNLFLKFRLHVVHVSEKCGQSMNELFCQDSALLSLSGCPLDPPQHNGADGDGFPEVKKETDEVETDPEKGSQDKDKYGS